MKHRKAIHDLLQNTLSGIAATGGPEVAEEILPYEVAINRVAAPTEIQLATGPDAKREALQAIAELPDLNPENPVSFGELAAAYAEALKIAREALKEDE